MSTEKNFIRGQQTFGFPCMVLIPMIIVFLFGMEQSKNGKTSAKDFVKENENMWLCDLEEAVKDLRKRYPNTVFEKVVPCYSGLAFFTTYNTIIYWSSKGVFEEREIS